MNKVKYICIKSDDTKAIMALEAVSKVTVYNALYYRTFGERPERIRSIALNQFGGKQCFKYK